MALSSSSADVARAFADFLDNAAYAIHIVGPDGTIRWVNRFALDMLGYARDEYVGRHVRDVYDDSICVAGTARCAAS
jgi:PAS domain S-box-containing protein